jgi:di/tricarboxylate transporter
MQIFSPFVVTSAVCALLFIGLVMEAMPAHVLMFLVLVLLMLAGILTPDQAFAGFSNREMLTVAILYIVAAGFHTTGLTEKLGGITLGKTRGVRLPMIRMMLIVAAISAFFNNTPIVAIFLPAVAEWCRKNNVAPSKLLMPLSYAAIFGGLCSVIGTSTNLVISGLMERASIGSMSFFEIGYIGLPAALIGMAYMITIGNKLLPNRKSPIEEVQDAVGDFMVNVCLSHESSLVGQTVEDACLRNLPGLFLVKIVRENMAIAPVKASEKLQAGDILYFSGDTATVEYIFKITGTQEVSDQPALNHRIRLVEAVIPAKSSLAGSTLKQSRFRSRYDGAVIAIYRGGGRVRGKLGDQRLHGGDVLLIMAGADFEKNIQNTEDILLISERAAGSQMDEGIPVWKKLVPFAILAAMVGAVVLNFTTMFIAACAAAFVTLITGIVRPQDALKHIEWNVLIVIACSFGIASALAKSGVAAAIGKIVVSHLGVYGPVAGIFAILVATCFVTELLTNNAAAALMFPLAIAIAQQFGADPRAFAIAVAVGASAGFALPFGYQTHLMVYSPGGYRFRDFLKTGIPLDLMYIATGALLIPIIWKL